MRRYPFIPFSVLLILCIGTVCSAAITISGDVTPDPTTMITSNYLLYVGESGDGNMTIDGGSQVTDAAGYIGGFTGAIGRVTVDGNSSMWDSSGDLYVGYRGHGTLAVTDGGRVSSNKGFIGWSATSMGDVTVDGTGSMWSTSELELSGDGMGTLTVSGGGSVNYDTCYIGINNVGTLTITDGGSIVSSIVSVIGYSSEGRIVVDGIGSSLISGDLAVGFSGSGTLIIMRGGSVRTNTSIGILNGGITVDGTDSTLINDGAVFMYDKLTISNGGYVSVGGSFDLIFDTSTLAVSLTSTSDPFLDVNGSVPLNGTLSVDLDPDLVLQPNDVFTIIEVGGVLSGQFIGLYEGDVAGTFGGMDLRISYEGGDGNDVELFAVLLGDMNGDGVVGTDDVGPFVLALTNRSAYDLAYGSLVNADFAGDIDHSGTFDLGDVAAFSTYLANLEEGGADAVPEPSALVLCALVFGGLVLSPRRARSEQPVA